MGAMSGWLEKHHFLVIAVVNGSILAAATQSTHGCAIRLFEKTVAERENIVLHDDIETFQDL
jgi:hypothetical protein